MDDQQEKMVRESLAQLVDALGGEPEKGRVRFWGDVAGRLSRMVGKNEPWDWRYPKQVATGQTRPSELFGRAVMALGATLDEVPEALAYADPVTVFARPGSVDAGSLILAGSRVCGRPGCKIKFVPRVPWQRYCSERCRRLYRKEMDGKPTPQPPS